MPDELRRRSLPRDHLDDGLGEASHERRRVGQQARAGRLAAEVLVVAGAEEVEGEGVLGVGLFTVPGLVGADDPRCGLRDAPHGEAGRRGGGRRGGCCGGRSRHHWAPCWAGTLVRVAASVPRPGAEGSSAVVGDVDGGGRSSCPGVRRSGSSPTTSRFAAYHRGHSQAISASVAPGPRCRAAMDHRESPRRTVTRSWAADVGRGCRRQQPGAVGVVDRRGSRRDVARAGRRRGDGGLGRARWRPPALGRPSGRSRGSARSARIPAPGRSASAPPPARGPRGPSLRATGPDPATDTGAGGRASEPTEAPSARARTLRTASGVTRSPTLAAARPAAPGSSAATASREPSASHAASSTPTQPRSEEQDVVRTGGRREGRALSDDGHQQGQGRDGDADADEAAHELSRDGPSRPDRAARDRPAPAVSVPCSSGTRLDADVRRWC